MIPIVPPGSLLLVSSWLDLMIDGSFLPKTAPDLFRSAFCAPPD